MSALVVDAVTRRFGGTLAVDRVSLTVAPGEIVGVLGPNGAGKSTLFQMIAGLERADAGAVHVLGVEVTRWPLWRRARGGLAYLPQGPSLLGDLTVAENVAVAARTAGHGGDLVSRLLEEEGLGELRDRGAASLSGGERRRVEIARARALGGRVWLLDEPFAGVDPAHIESLRRRILRLAAEGVAVLLTDHQVREVLPLCHRALLLDAGVVQVEGPPSAIVADSRARDRYLGPSFRLDPPAAPLHPGPGV